MRHSPGGTAAYFRKILPLWKTAEKGSGLGLAIMKSIADRHSILLEIQSTYGQGTTVVFTVPSKHF